MSLSYVLVKISLALSQIRVCIGNLFSLFLIQTYVVGTQKNHLNETVLLSLSYVLVKISLALSQIRVCIGNLFSLFLIQTYVVGTQKNHLNETVLLSTQNTSLN